MLIFQIELIFPHKVSKALKQGTSTILEDERVSRFEIWKEQTLEIIQIFEPPYLGSVLLRSQTC